MQSVSDIVVVGVGGMGASAAYQLGRHGVRVTCFEQFDVGHIFGSSHGESRIIRQACYEHPSYAPLSMRSYELLDELEARTGKRHSVRCGGLMLGRRDSTPVKGSLQTARLYGLRHEMLESPDLRRRYPGLNVPTDHVAFYEAGAGAVFPEMMVRSWVGAAKASGVEIWTQRRVTAIEPTSGGVRVTGEGFEIDAGQAIITAGPWLDAVLPEMRDHLSVERIVQHWFKPKSSRHFAPDVFPIFYWDLGAYQLYGFPSVDPAEELVKVGLDNDRRPCRPDHVDRDVGPEEVERLDAAVAVHIPALQGMLVRSEPCLWTVSRDRDVIIGRHPRHEQIIVAGGCSGRGFKFAAVIGEILAQLAITGATRHDIARLSPNRFLQEEDAAGPSHRSGPRSVADRGGFASKDQPPGGHVHAQ